MNPKVFVKIQLILNFFMVSIILSSFFIFSAFFLIIFSFSSIVLVFTIYQAFLWLTCYAFLKAEPHLSIYRFLGKYRLFVERIAKNIVKSLLYLPYGYNKYAVEKFISFWEWFFSQEVLRADILP